MIPYEYEFKMVPVNETLSNFYKRVLNSDSRILQGTERDHMLTLFQFLEPLEKNTRQRVIRSIYYHAHKIYWVTYGDETVVEELEGYYDLQ